MRSLNPHLKSTHPTDSTELNGRIIYSKGITHVLDCPVEYKGIGDRIPVRSTETGFPTFLLTLILRKCGVGAKIVQACIEKCTTKGFGRSYLEEVYPYLRGWREKNNFRKKNALSIYDRDSNSNLPIMGSLVYCKNIGLRSHVATKRTSLTLSHLQDGSIKSDPDSTMAVFIIPSQQMTIEHRERERDGGRSKDLAVVVPDHSGPVKRWGMQRRRGKSLQAVSLKLPTTATHAQ
ncbi:unnamed protein product [Timema podura]|uniref:Uncharacterized protein n=1 Tax=Timema podura TaxID=61482 RepID=A0ABN7P063_TIMPD|nr:unnamed protein product [Timema podura]